MTDSLIYRCGISVVCTAERCGADAGIDEFFSVPDFRKLRVWCAAEELAIDVHRIAGGIRDINLSNQLRRAVMSVPTNIVEGNAHRSPRERARYLGYALASLWEVDGHVQLAHDVGLVSKNDYEILKAKIIDIRKMLYGLLRKVRSWT